MEITEAMAKKEMLKFYKARAEDKVITSGDEYEMHLYKCIVSHLNKLNGDNWGKFEYLTWMAAVEYYEIDNDLPRKLWRLIFELESKPDHTFLKFNEKEQDPEEESIAEKTLRYLKKKMPEGYKPITTYAEYEYHLHKVMDVRFDAFFAKYTDERFLGYELEDQYYNPNYWRHLVEIYEYENNLPRRSSQIDNIERFGGFRQLRNNLPKK